MILLLWKVSSRRRTGCPVSDHFPSSLMSATVFGSGGICFLLALKSWLCCVEGGQPLNDFSGGVVPFVVSKFVWVLLWKWKGWALLHLYIVWILDSLSVLLQRLCGLQGGCGIVFRILWRAVRLVDSSQLCWKVVEENEANFIADDSDDEKVYRLEPKWR